MEYLRFYNCRTTARKNEIREGLQKIIETLPTKQRMALTLYYLGDEKQTYHEIGEVLGINEETARSQVRYAKNKIPFSTVI